MEKGSDLKSCFSTLLNSSGVQVLNRVLRIQAGERVNRFSETAVLQHNGPDLFFVGFSCQLLKLGDTLFG